MSGEMRALLLMAVAFGAGALLGAMLIHRNWPRAFGALLAGHLFALVGLVAMGRHATGFDGIAYAMMLFVFVLPASLGMILGGSVVWWRKRRTQG